MIRSERASLFAGSTRSRPLLSDSDNDNEEDKVVTTRKEVLASRSHSMDAVKVDKRSNNDFLRLDNYELDDAAELVADEEFFSQQRTPSRSSQNISPAVTRVAVDKTPIMLMKQMNRLSVPILLLWFLINQSNIQIYIFRYNIVGITKCETVTISICLPKTKHS